MCTYEDQEESLWTLAKVLSKAKKRICRKLAISKTLKQWEFIPFPFLNQCHV